MGRGARKRGTPYAPKVERVEVSDRHVKGRIIAAAVFLIIGAAAIGYGVSQLVHVESGWQVVSASNEAQIYGADFALTYELGASGKSARSEKNAIVRAYSDALLKAGRAFDPDTESEGNIRALNASPNREVELDPLLYEAFELLERYGDRTAYLGPAFDIYENIFFCREDWETADFDPQQNDYLRELFAKIAAFAGDPESVRVELLGDSRARLAVSDEYLAFLEDEELSHIVDFAWMKNAFIIDCLAETLTAEGFTRGSVSSYDGFAVNLGGAVGEEFGLNIFDCPEDTPLQAATLIYQGKMSIAAYRNFPVSSQDSQRVYVTDEGERKTLYLGAEDGLPHTAADSLTAWSRELPCAEVMLLSSKIYRQTRIGEPDLSALASNGVMSAAVMGKQILLTDPEAKLQNVYSGYSVKTVE